MATRTATLEPAGQGPENSQQWTTFGSAEPVYKVLSKGKRSPEAVSETSGIESSVEGKTDNIFFDPEFLPFGLGQGEHIKQATLWFYAKAAAAEPAMEAFMLTPTQTKAEKVKGVTAKWWKTQLAPAALGVANVGQDWEAIFKMLRAEKCSVYAAYLEVTIEYPTVISEFIEEEWLETKTEASLENKVGFGGLLTPNPGNNLTAVIATTGKGASEVFLDNAAPTVNMTLDAEATQAGITIQVWSHRLGVGEIAPQAVFTESEKLVSIACFEWSGFKVTSYLATQGKATGESTEPKAETEAALDAEGDMVLYAEAVASTQAIFTHPTNYELLSSAKQASRALSAGAAFNNTPTGGAKASVTGKNSKSGKWACVVVAYRAQTEPITEQRINLNMKDPIKVEQTLAAKLTSKLEFKDSLKAVFKEGGGVVNKITAFFIFGDE